MIPAFFILFLLLALTGRKLMRAAVGLGTPEPAPTLPPAHFPPRGPAKRPLILQLAASGSLTNSRPLCPPRQPLNPQTKTRS